MKTFLEFIFVYKIVKMKSRLIRMKILIPLMLHDAPYTGPWSDGFETCTVKYTYKFLNFIKIHLTIVDVYYVKGGPM